MGFAKKKKSGLNIGFLKFTLEDTKKEKKSYVIYGKDLIPTIDGLQHSLLSYKQNRANLNITGKKQPISLKFDKRDNNRRLRALNLE